MAPRVISILEGGTFVVSDPNGDIVADPLNALGLFHRDTRFLSRWRLTMDGHPLSALSTDDLVYFKAQFFLVPGPGDVYTNSKVSVMRQRAVGDGFHEDLTVFNYGSEPIETELRMEVDADFADLFEVKDALAKKGSTYRRSENGRIVLGYERETYRRETWITATAAEAELDDEGIRFRIRVPPQTSWTTCLEVVTAVDGTAGSHDRACRSHDDLAARPTMDASLEEWIDGAPKLESSWSPLEGVYLRSLVDLAALRYHPEVLPDHAVPAAGLPWFMTLFGRDSLITSFQTLPFQSELAATTLRVLGARQGVRVDEFRDEEPGKVLHELRRGELTAFEERPHSPYYGSADSTMLFLILLDEYERWTEDRALVRELEPNARAALAWIDEHGDRDGDGYVEYERRNPETGLENQCWKDSWDSILFPDGTLAPLPRATCELQGYAYDAKLRCARLARHVWGDDELADRLEREAGDLKERFNEDFWVDDGEFFALALDGQKRQVQTLTSNIGHLLWSGIADEDKAARCAAHLMGERLFSGWGIRTMATGYAGYNPIGYHTGTVWPHDNSLICLGLVRYGFREEASRLAYALSWAAALYFDDRLPEAFAGYPREATHFPVEYPTACSPQAWAAGAPLVFVRAMLGLEPKGSRLLVEPALPPEIAWIELEGVRGPWGSANAVAGEPAEHELRASMRTAVRRPKELSLGPLGVHAGARVGAAPTTVSLPGSAREFFEMIARSDSVWPNSRSGTCRFEVDGAGSWRFQIDDGQVSVSESDAESDCTFELTEDVLMRIVRGEQNASTAYLRGLLQIRGDLELADEFRRYVLGMRGY